MIAKKNNFTPFVSDKLLLFELVVEVSVEVADDVSDIK